MKRRLLLLGLLLAACDGITGSNSDPGLTYLANISGQLRENITMRPPGEPTFSCTQVYHTHGTVEVRLTTGGNNVTGEMAIDAVDDYIGFVGVDPRCPHTEINKGEEWNGRISGTSASFSIPSQTRSSTLNSNISGSMSASGSFDAATQTVTGTVTFTHNASDSNSTMVGTVTLPFTAARS